MSATPITHAEQNLYLRQLRFPSDLEASYRTWNYVNVLGILRIAVLPVVAFALYSTVRDFLYLHNLVYTFGGNGGVILLCLLLFGLTAKPAFEKVWQPVTTLLIWAAMTIMLNSPMVMGIHSLPVNEAPPMSQTASASIVSSQRRVVNPASHATLPLDTSETAPDNRMLMVQLYTLLIFLAAFRLGFRWTMLLNVSLLLSAYWTQSLHPNLVLFSARSLLLLFALMIAALAQERLSRSAFLANYLLDQERNDERLKREQTEGMLHVLSQAIGGIVHDLGSPLTAVQGGAQLLKQMGSSQNDPEAFRELTEVIQEGVQILNYQRLSLMEQTRILEGKPIPVECRPAFLRRLIETSIRYQKPRFAYGKQVIMDDGDVELYVDDKKLTTVFMNLIGNAMKYSDGAIRVHWQTDADNVWIAVLDQGMVGRGLSEMQARKLFVPFGRLETHAEIEGTGLGLLSVRKILEAHDGEVYIEGHRDGNLASSVFSTAASVHPSLLQEGFLTAFVVVCPNDILS